MKTFDLTLPAKLKGDLFAHLFPGDGDEHGAVVACGVVETSRGLRLLGRELLIAEEGVDYVPGKRGYRMLTPQFVMSCARHCRNERLAYLAVHNHGGTTHVGFSGADMASHERGYPALVDVLGGLPVGRAGVRAGVSSRGPLVCGQLAARASGSEGSWCEYRPSLPHPTACTGRRGRNDL